MLKEKILFVEDEPDIQELVRYNLSNDGYSVDCTDSGANALSQIKKTKPDLVLLDLMLPDIDGLEICRSIKNSPSTCDIPVIMITAKKLEDDIVHGFKAGANDYMTKPFSIKELSCRVKSALSQKRKPDAKNEDSFNPYHSIFCFNRF